MKPRKPLKRVTEKQLEKNKLKKEETQRMHAWFLEIWDEREDEDGYVRCFETDVLMHRSRYRENPACYSHCLPKSRYKEIAFDPRNILIVLPSVHAKYEWDHDRTPRMKAYLEQLKIDLDM
jgi:hypothetical protein